MKRFLNSLDTYATLNGISKQYSESNEGSGISSLVEIPSLLGYFNRRMVQNQRVNMRIGLLNVSDRRESWYSRNRIDHSESSSIILKNRNE